MSDSGVDRLHPKAGAVLRSQTLYHTATLAYGLETLLYQIHTAARVAAAAVDR